MRDKFLIFGAPQLAEDDLDVVMDVFRSGWIGTGPKAAELETFFARYVGSKHAVALSSCTAALHLALLAANLKPGDEVITTPVTYCATANAILHAGAVPVFADVDRTTGLIDRVEIEKHITPKTRALLPVHLEGRSCDMKVLREIAERHKLLLIEDCAHAIETTFDDRHAGTFGLAGCFSFYVTKNATGIEGGMLVTDDDSIAAKAKILASNGLDRNAWKRFSDEGYKHYQTVSLGYKYNLPDVHAALALNQLKRIEENLQRRETVWRRYDEAFAGLPCTLPPAAEDGTRHARHLYRLLLDLEALSITRDHFIAELHKRKIGCGVHYLALHLHQYYRETFGFKPDDYPNALWHSDRTVSLPLSAGMTDDDVNDVINAVRVILLQYRTA